MLARDIDHFYSLIQFENQIEDGMKHNRSFDLKNMRTKLIVKGDNFFQVKFKASLFTFIHGELYVLLQKKLGLYK